MLQSKLYQKCSCSFLPTSQFFKTLLTSNSNSTQYSIQTNNVQKRYLRQRKFKNVLENPFDMVDEYKKNQQAVSSILDAPENTGIKVYDSLVAYNIKRYEEARNKGVIPGEELLQEEPQHQVWVDFMKKGKPKAGDYVPGVSKRAGIIAQKVGMVPYWDSYHSRVPLTVLQIPKCQVVQVKTKDKDGYYALQLGAGSHSAKKLTKPLLGHCQKAGVEPKHVFGETRVTEDGLLPVGFELTARHFVPGQYVDITARSKGKGFAGVMKKYGFGGQPATHGVSVVHRSLGGTGTHIGKVFKGKKMAGRMGHKQVTQLNYYIYKIDIKTNCIFVKGSVPGPIGAYLYICDARRNEFESPPPFPSFFPPEGEDIDAMTEEEQILVAPGKIPYIWQSMGLTKEEVARARREDLPKVLTQADQNSIKNAELLDKAAREKRAKNREEKRMKLKQLMEQHDEEEE
ncbi:hypothetical protein ABK040_006867 [Willaertia magna]